MKVQGNEIQLWVLLPKVLREAMKIKKGTEVNWIVVNNNKLYLKIQKNEM